jgi:hypothetical protein
MKKGSEQELKATGIVHRSVASVLYRLHFLDQKSSGTTAKRTKKKKKSWLHSMGTITSVDLYPNWCGVKMMGKGCRYAAVPKATDLQSDCTRQAKGKPHVQHDADFKREADKPYQKEFLSRV